MFYSNSRNSFNVRPLCFRMSASVPFASAECIGTTVLKAPSGERFSKETWLPFWRNSTNPARLSARTTRSPETLGSFATSMRDFYGCPKLLGLERSLFRHAPGFQVQLDSFPKIPSSALDIAALRSHAQLRTTRNIEFFFFGNQHRESVSHMAMLADVAQPGKQHEKRTSRIS